MTRKRIVLGMVLIMAISLGISSEGVAASKKYLSLGTGNPSGTFYFIGAGFANIINKHVPEVRVIAESTAASEENFHLIIRNRMDLGMVAIHVIDPAVEKKLDFSGMRLIALGHTSDRHWIVRKESPIHSISDFKGKKVAVGSPGSGTLVSSRMELDATVGIKMEEITPAYLSFSESITALRDQTVDVGCVSAGYPVASILDLASKIGIRLIPYSEKEMDALMKKHPFYVRVVIPAGTYRGVDTPTLTRGIASAIFCRKELSEDLVYRMMKAVYDHPKDKNSIHPQAAQWNMETMFRGAEYTTQYIPFHPGAVRFLKEKGVWKKKFEK